MALITKLLLSIHSCFWEAFDGHVSEEVGIAIRTKEKPERGGAFAFSYDSVVFFVDGDILGLAGSLVDDKLIPFSAETMPNLGKVAVLESKFRNAVANAILNADTPVFVPGVLVRELQEYSAWMEGVIAEHKERMAIITDAVKAVEMVKYEAMALGVGSPLVNVAKTDPTIPIKAMVEFQSALAENHHRSRVYHDLTNLPKLENKPQ